MRVSNEAKAMVLVSTRAGVAVKMEGEGGGERRRAR